MCFSIVLRPHDGWSFCAFARFCQCIGHYTGYLLPVDLNLRVGRCFWIAPGFEEPFSPWWRQCFARCLVWPLLRQGRISMWPQRAEKSTRSYLVPMIQLVGSTCPFRDKPTKRYNCDGTERWLSCAFATFTVTSMRFSLAFATFTVNPPRPHSLYLKCFHQKVLIPVHLPFWGGHEVWTLVAKSPSMVSRINNWKVSVKTWDLNDEKCELSTNDKKDPRWSKLVSGRVVQQQKINPWTPLARQAVPWWRVFTILASVESSSMFTILIDYHHIEIDSFRYRCFSIFTWAFFLYIEIEK